MKDTTQIKSKTRVRDQGEVFTNEREVNAMLDLVKQETERIDSRFLEPACGTGNFLIEILNRKLNVCYEKYRKSQHDYEKYSLLSLMSIYGIDLMEDNVEECRDRLFHIWKEQYIKSTSRKPTEDIEKVATFILSRNIQIGDALTLKTESGKPIVFSEWSFIKGDLVKRRDYEFAELINDNNDDINLFNSSKEQKIGDNGKSSFIPKTINEHKPISYRRLINE